LGSRFWVQGFGESVNYNQGGQNRESGIVKGDSGIAAWVLGSGFWVQGFGDRSTIIREI
jgi:hypothetical protein